MTDPDVRRSGRLRNVVMDELVKLLVRVRSGRFALRTPIMSMRQLLAMVVLLTALPLIGLSIILFLEMVANERRSVRDGLMANARSLAELVDNEIDTHIAVAASLATSPSLENRDLVAFRSQALRALKVIPGAWLSLSDPTGLFVMSTLLEPGATLPPRGRREIMEMAWATGKPQVSDTLLGPLSKRINATVEYPVFRASVPLFTIVIGLEPNRFNALVRDKYPAAAVIGIVDRQHKFVARVPGQDERVGTLASDGWRAGMNRAPEGFTETPTLEGDVSLTAYAPTRDGWTVGIAYPIATLDAPLRRIMWGTAVLGTLLMLAGLALGLGFARRLTSDMARLANAARTVGAGQVVAPAEFGIKEATSISRILSESSLELARRDAAMRESEAKFRGTFENAAVGVAHIALDGGWLDVNARLCEILGYTLDELRIRRFQDLLHPDDLEAHRADLRKLLSREITSYTTDRRLIRKDGSAVWIGLTAAFQHDASRGPQYGIAVIRDVTARKQAQDHQRFLLDELAHRTKNQLAVIQAMARQTARNAKSLQDFEQQFMQRIQGLAVSINLLVSRNWAGVTLAELVQRHLEPFKPDDARMTCEGPPVTVSAEAAQSIGLALHELATNSVKHGAWSDPNGRVEVSWHLERNGTDTSRLRMNWLERGGPSVRPPTGRGFGQVVIEQMVAQKLDAKVEMSFPPEGMSWTLVIPDTHFSVGSIASPLRPKPPERSDAGSMVQH